MTTVTIEKPLSQKQLVLRLLREHPEGCCIVDFEQARFGLGYIARNRISDLLHDGHAIVSRPCRLHQHRSRSVARYSLTGVVLQLEIPE